MCPYCKTPWTAKDDEVIREMVSDGSPDREIAEVLNRTKTAIRQRRTALRRKARVPGDRSANDCRYLKRDNEGRPPAVEQRLRALVAVEMANGETSKVAATLGICVRGARGLLRRMERDTLVEFREIGPRRGRWVVLKHGNEE